MKYYAIHETSKIIGVSPQTLRNWDRKGKLQPHHMGTNGYRYHAEEQVNTVLGIRPRVDKNVIGYCRVSSSKQNSCKANVRARPRP